MRSRGSVNACRRVAAVSLLVLVGSLLTGCFGGTDKDTAAGVQRIGNAVQLGTPKSGVLIASPQRNDGSFVLVDEAVLPKGGYVAVYADGNGAPGARLGTSKLLKSGESKDIRVLLKRRLSSGVTVHVMLHQEDSKNASLDFPKHDAPVVAEGRIVEIPINVTVKSK